MQQSEEDDPMSTSPPTTIQAAAMPVRMAPQVPPALWQQMTSANDQALQVQAQSTTLSVTPVAQRSLQDGSAVAQMPET